MSEIRTGCPYCGTGCGLIARVADGRLAEVKGDPLHPVNRGATCRKPLRLPDAVHSADRATTPLLRRARGDRWEPSTWRRAIGSLARRLEAISAEHGPESIAFYVSGQLLTEDLYAVNKLAKGFLGTNNVDSNSRLCMSSAVAGYAQTYGHDGPPPSYVDLDQADCMLLVGTNTAACHPIVWQRIRRRQRDGAKVIVADPRRTPTAAAADVHLPVRPGTDLPLLNAIAHVLGRESLVDSDFVARRTDGAEAALASAAEWPPARAAEVCGVEASAIEAAALIFGRARRAMTVWSMGANQSIVGTLKNRALNNLCLLTGNLGRPGTGPLSLTGQPNAMGGREVGTLAALLPGYRRVDSAEDRAEMRRLWSIPAEVAGVSPAPGLTATELVDALEDGRVRALWIAGTNPVVSQPDSERFAAALARAELVVVQDAYHPTETGALAHAVLPAAAWPEKDGTMTNSERRMTPVRRALDPPGEALADWEIFARLARALGHGERFGWRSAAEVFDEFAATTAGRPCDVSGASHERLRREGSLQWPVPAHGHDGEAHDGTERLYASGRLATPTGRAQLAATPHTEPADAPDADFPIVLTTGRLAGQWHTMTRTGKSPDLMTEAREPFVDLHPADAARAGVGDGQLVRVRSRRGFAHLRAKVSDAVPEGTAFAPFHWGAAHLEPGWHALNAITPNALDPTSKQAELKATAVRIELSTPDVRRTSGAARAPRTLVVGAGMAGLRVVEALVDHGVAGSSIQLVGDEPDLPYDRIRLPRLLDPATEASSVSLREAGWFEAHGLSVRSGARVERLDLDGGRALLADGDELEFDRLVLATGSRAALPPIAGLDRGGVHAFRSLTDARELAASARRDAPAVVVGGGLLGLEAARGLQARGMDVTVVHLADRLMEQQLDPIAAGMLERRMAELGIAVELGAMTTEVAGNGHVEGVRLADGRALEAALVVVATGIRPNVELARAAGLDVARGVVVDDELRTSHGAVWAVGECAEHRGTVHGLVAPARRQAEVAAAVMAGRPAAFHGSVPATRLKVMGVDLFCVGAPAAEPGDDELLALDSRSGRYRKLVLRGERLTGAILLGELSDAALLHRSVERGTAVPRDLLAAGTAPARATGDQLVCSCNSVTREALTRAVHVHGATDVSAVARATGATTGCGGCAPEVERIVAQAHDEAAELADVRLARAVGHA